MIDSPLPGGSSFVLGPSPEIFPHSLHAEAAAVQLVRLDEAGYREASFLDNRLLNSTTPGRLASWIEVAQAAADLPPPSFDLVFHIGHVGSTLLSRILGDHPRVFSLREPLILRQIATTLIHDPAAIQLVGYDTPAQTLSVLGRFWSRTFRPEQRTLIKATSYVSGIGAPLMASASGSRALCLLASPQIHMATLLAGEHNLKEVDAFAPLRWARLKALAAVQEPDWTSLSVGPRIAMTWAAEAGSLGFVVRHLGPAAHIMDFDAMLADPRGAIAGALTHLHGHAEPADVERLARSPHFGRYSKAQSFEYSPQLRQHVLRQAWTDHSTEIAKGLDWLQNILSRSPALSAALQPFMRGVK